MKFNIRTNGIFIDDTKIKNYAIKDNSLILTLDVTDGRTLLSVLQEYHKGTITKIEVSILTDNNDNIFSFIFMVQNNKPDLIYENDDTRLAQLIFPGHISYFVGA